ncbi:hypothetical protein VTH06DRAFT_2264 [Thermothelomyces fergusii]
MARRFQRAESDACCVQQRDMARLLFDLPMHCVISGLDITGGTLSPSSLPCILGLFAGCFLSHFASRWMGFASFSPFSVLGQLLVWEAYMDVHTVRDASVIHSG